MNTTLGTLRRASRKTYKSTGKSSAAEKVVVKKMRNGWFWSEGLRLIMWYLSTGLLWRLGADRVKSGQIQAVHWQLVQVVQQGRGQVGALSGALSPDQEQTRPVRCGLSESRARDRAKFKISKKRSNKIMVTEFQL